MNLEHIVMKHQQIHFMLKKGSAQNYSHLILFSEKLQTIL